MRGNVKTIKLTAWLSLLLVVITYIITIKGSLGVCENKWIPDTFLLAVFGGAFASMLVVLICEISKYFQNRETAETYLVSHLYYLYGQVQVISKNIDFLIKQKECIHKNALTQLIANAEAEMNTVYYADYAPFRKNNGILAVKLSYNNKVFPVIQQFLQNCRQLEIAVITDAIKREQGIEDDADNKTHLVLEKLSEQIQEPISLIDELLTKIDRLCHGRYNWPKVRNDLIKRMPDNRIDTLEQFLQK